MSTIKTLTYAIVAAAALAFCAPSARAVIPVTTTTNDLMLSLALTMTTNVFNGTSETNYAETVGQEKLTTKTLLVLLGGSDFANETFSNGDQVAIAYDAPWNGDVVVVDKTGSNVLYDATFNHGNTNATVVIDLFHESPFCAQSEKILYKAGGSISLTSFGNGSFKLYDKNNVVNITGSGPATIKFAQTLNSASTFSVNPYAAWTATATFSFYGAMNEVFDSQGDLTISGTITAKGSRKGGNSFILNNFVR